MQLFRRGIEKKDDLLQLDKPLLNEAWSLSFLDGQARCRAGCVPAKKFSFAMSFIPARRVKECLSFSGRMARAVTVFSKNPGTKCILVTHTYEEVVCLISEGTRLLSRTEYTK